MSQIWIRIEEGMPLKEPKLFHSKSKLVTIQEFGCEPMLAIAYCWQSALPGQQPVWYLDEAFYHLDCPYHAGEVIAWMDIPDLPTARTLQEELFEGMKA